MLSRGKKKPQQLTRKEIKESKPGEILALVKLLIKLDGKDGRMGKEFT